ncbi:MAG: substrate-binding domain-containing protein [Xanthobacteraceae bacterium]|nr:substrate-binding domain-containing protein [Xanthobacteraceae bacterium]
MIRKAFLVPAIVLLSANIGPTHADDIKVGGTGAAQGVLLRLSDEFRKRQPAHDVEVVFGLGSSGAIAAVVEGALQFSFSGRALKPEEIAKGLEFAPIFDTPFLFVTSHPQPQALKKSDVVAIYDGVLTRWPDGKPIKPVLRPKSDGATVFLISNFSGIEKAMDRLRLRPDVPVAATDQDNTQIAERIPNSFAGITLAQFVTERPRLRKVSLDGIEASVEAMEKGTHTLNFRVYYVIKSKRSVAVQRFLEFVRSPQGEEIVRASGARPVSAKTALVR